MGVHGLWELLSPVGERVPNSHVRNKRVAVDASIWLTQFIRAMRDSEGAQVANAHLIGVFRRCCKLLFLNVKPVLVFDGATPPLKRRTREIRRSQHDRDVAKLRRLAERLLMNQMRRAATGAISGAIQKRGRRKAEPNGRGSKRPRLETCSSEPLDAELEVTEDSVNLDPEISVELPDDVHEIDDQALVNLPANVQAAIFKQIRQAQRKQHREQVMSRQTDPESFSKAQIAGFMKNTTLNRRIRTVRNAINDRSGANQRIASDSSRAFLLEEGDHVDDEEDVDNENNEDENLDFEDSDGEMQVKRSEMRMTEPDQQLDVLSKIRVQRERRIDLNELALRKNPKMSKSHDVGLGWAAKVLESSGTHKLGANEEDALGNQAYLSGMSNVESVGSDDSDEWEDPVRNVSGTANHIGQFSSDKDDNESATDEWEDAVVTERKETIEAKNLTSDSNDELTQEMQFAILQSTAVRFADNVETARASAILKDEAKEGADTGILKGSLKTIAEPEPKVRAIHLTDEAFDSIEDHPNGTIDNRNGDSANNVAVSDPNCSKFSIETPVNETTVRERPKLSDQEEEDPPVLSAENIEHSQTEIEVKGSDSAGKESSERKITGPANDAEADATAHRTLEDSSNLFNDDPSVSAIVLGASEVPEGGTDSSVVNSAQTMLKNFKSGDDVDEIRPAVQQEDMERLRIDLEREHSALERQHNNQQRVIGSVTDEMVAETCELLRLFGIPFVQAPFEAEAQCAHLEKVGLVDGVITEDSDVFLFGARTVYRRLFADGKFAEEYTASTIERELGVDRNKLIQLAYLLGSDYTSGVRGIGIVNAMEVLQAFPGCDGLGEFFEWTKTVTMFAEKPEEEDLNSRTQSAMRRAFCWKHRVVKRNWVFRSDFPDPRVRKEYLNPPVNRSAKNFNWGRVEFDGLQQFCWRKFGWDKSKFDEIVGPLRSELEQRKRRGPEQRRIEEFFKPFRFAKIKSVRLQRAVRGMAGEDNSNHIMAESGELGIGNRAETKKEEEENELDNLFMQIDEEAIIQEQKNSSKPKLSQREELERLGREALYEV